MDAKDQVVENMEGSDSDAPNLLEIKVHDKDHFVDDTLGFIFFLFPVSWIFSLKFDYIKVIEGVDKLCEPPSVVDASMTEFQNENASVKGPVKNKDSTADMLNPYGA
nr:hypothetical protein [Tanacetum cinerariifolium]